MIIPSLLDTDLYKFTMMQVVQHHFAEAQVEYRFKCRNPDVDLTPYIAEIEDEIRALTGLRFAPRRTRLPAPLALLQERLRRPAGAVPARPAIHHRHPPHRLAARNRHHDQGSVAPHDPVRGAGARDRVRGLLPQHGPRARFRRGAAPSRREDRAGERGARQRLPDRRLRHAPTVFPRVAGGGAADAEGRHAAATSSAPATSGSRSSRA